MITSCGVSWERGEKLCCVYVASEPVATLQNGAGVAITEFGDLTGCISKFDLTGCAAKTFDLQRKCEDNCDVTRARV